MGRTQLFLVDGAGRALLKEHRQAVQAAFDWVQQDYANLDPSLLSTWAEQVGSSLAQKADEIRSPHRYALAALQGKVKEYYRRAGAHEIQGGLTRDFEQWAELDEESMPSVERKILFEQIHSRLNNRDRTILVLLQQDVTSPKSIASALDISYMAAGKAVQRLKERVRAILTGKEPPQALERLHEDD